MRARAPAAARALGLRGATALVVANMVGTGVFVTSGFMARELGSAAAVLAMWVVGGAFALSGATVYAELGAMMPRAGGEYVYLARAFHPAVGFLSGFVSLLVGFSAPIAASAMACASYASAAWPLLPVKATAALLIVALSAVHMLDVLWGARVQVVLTAMKVALVAAFVALGITIGEGSWAHFSLGRAVPGASAAAVSLVFVAFAYSGWNAAAYVAGELREPSRTLPLALLVGTGIVIALYLGLNVAFFYAAEPNALAADPEVVADIAARALFGDRVARAMSTLIALGLVSSVSAMVMAGPRVTMAMAEDGLFFRAFARRSRGGAPFVSIGAHGALSLALLFTATFESLLTYIGFTLSAFSALTVLGAMRLRAREPEADRPYRAALWPLTPALFVALATFLVAFSIRERPVVAAAGLGTLALGLLLYSAWAWRLRRSQAE